jgi:hypothetical protein
MARRKTTSGELLHAIGDRGENLFELAISDYSQFNRPLFRPAYFTDRWPAVDYVVELLGVADLTPYLLVQVKATRVPIANNEIAIDLPPRKKNSLARLPGPTYVVGVQEPTRRVFIRAAFATTGPGIYSIPITHELTPANLQVLYDEVEGFWRNQDPKPQQSHFS